MRINQAGSTELGVLQGLHETRDDSIYLASKDGYQDQVWFTGSPEEALDLLCDLHVTNADS